MSEKKLERVVLFLMIVPQFATAVTFPTYVLFLLGNGLTQFEANIVNTVFMLSGIPLEPLSGWVADKIGQRKTFLWGLCFWALAMTVYGLSSNFGQFIFSEVIASIGRALMSDALESWVRNKLGSERAHKLVARGQSLGYLVSIPSGVAGSFVAVELGFTIPWLMAGIGCFLGLAVGILAFSRLNNGQGEDVEERVNWRKCFEVIKGSPALQLSIFADASFAFLTQGLNMFWSPIFIEQGVSPAWLGIMWAFMAIALSMGSRWARRIEKVTFKTLAISLLLVGVPVFVASVTNIPEILVGMFVLHETGRGAFRPFVFTLFNLHEENEIRSSMNGLRSTVRVAVSGLGLFATGYMTTFISSLQVWMIIGICFILLAMFFLAQKEK